ncbi:MAG: tRNA (N(6)-L-threonylcarbamoyladenosine(37)-C(2))-methylthiotransferase MtaB [Bacteriovoracia bacterium]
MNMKVSFYTLGCRLNFSETGALVEQFKKQGFEVVAFEQEADVVYINTCTVTAQADSSCRNAIRRAHKFSPKAKIIVAGCYSQVSGEEVRKLPGVVMVLGSSEKDKVFEYINELEHKHQIVKTDQGNEIAVGMTTLADNHTRAFLKIQDGCDYFCSYCIIPYARGRSRSLPFDEVLKHAEEILDQGFKEIILTGVNIGEYSVNEGGLEKLVQKLLTFPKLQRLRLSSIEPNKVTTELLETLAPSSKFLPHFHIPIQSAHPRILKEMKRKYSIKEYEAVSKKVLNYFPNTALGTDVIVGFPGETQDEFEQAYEWIKQSSITHLHIFPYSKREGTKASKLSGHLSNAIKKERAKRLRKLAEDKLDQFARKFIGTSQNVLFEKKNDQGFWNGLTPQFLRIEVPDQGIDLNNAIKEVKVSSLQNGVLKGFI